MVNITMNRGKSLKFESSLNLIDLKEKFRNSPTENNVAAGRQFNYKMTWALDNLAFYIEI